MTIRPASREDYPAVCQYDRHIPGEKVAECIKNRLIFVLCDAEKIVGILRYSLFWQTIPFLDLAYIDEAYRGKGLGRQMMAHWEAAMGAQGYDHVMLSTQADETAKDFYEKLGYRRIGAFLPPDQDAEELMYLKEL